MASGWRAGRGVGNDRPLTPQPAHWQFWPQVQSLGPLQPQVDPQLHAIVEWVKMLFGIVKTLDC